MIGKLAHTLNGVLVFADSRESVGTMWPGSRTSRACPDTTLRHRLLRMVKKRKRKYAKGTIKKTMPTHTNPALLGFRQSNTL
mmetsp:Transcript_90660/g.198764  ORF Transcript_90660/g.198764 Transcript_90660/m.198764 type:complete len:82 (+) Transcript_90660:106-351(+)